MTEHTSHEQTSSATSPEWHGSFEQGIAELTARAESITWDEIIEFTFEKGILDRLAPADPMVKSARRAEHRHVYDESRDNPALYKKLFYSVENARENLHNSADLSWVNAWGGMYRALVSNNDIRERLFAGVDGEDMPEFMLDKLQERIRQEYKTAGGTRELEPLPDNEPLASFHGIKVKVMGANPDGLIRLEALDEAGHARLYRLTNKGRGMDPAHLYSKDFVYEK